MRGPEPGPLDFLFFLTFFLKLNIFFQAIGANLAPAFRASRIIDTCVISLTYIGILCLSVFYILTTVFYIGLEGDPSGQGGI